MKKNLIVFGTRPEAIKMAPLVRAFLNNPNFITKICVTAQHREMLDQVLDFFEIVPDYDLNLMKPNQNLYSLTADIIEGMKPVMEEVMPDYVFVHGDSTTSMAAGIAAFYGRAKVCHVEAGLRTGNIYSPWPEEMNRKLTSSIADIHFAPTVWAKNNLIAEECLFIDDTKDNTDTAAALGIHIWNIDETKENVIDLFSIKEDLF